MLKQSKSKIFSALISGLNWLRSRVNLSLHLSILISIILLFCFYKTYSVIANPSDGIAPDLNEVLWYFLVDTMLSLCLVIVLTWNVLKEWLRRNELSEGSRLQRRIVLMFAGVASVPTLLMAIFSTFFFNFGIQNWFDKKITSVLDNSMKVANSYIKEHKETMRNTALSMADDLDRMYYSIINDRQFLEKIINGQADVRSLAEALLFSAETNTILGQSLLTFSLPFSNIEPELMERAMKGEVVELKDDPNKIRMLVRLRHGNCYLIIGRFIDSQAINYVNETTSTATEYKHLKQERNWLQIKFSLIFILIAILLLLASISFGVVFSSNLVRPIKKLVKATEEVKQGDLTTRVREGPKDDEIGVLMSAFNRMIKKLDHQNKDLIIAQRAAAWADVAKRVAHEIKNPLTPIQLSLERLDKKFKPQVDDEEKFTRYISTIQRHTSDIRRIVSEFVNFSKMPTPKFEKCEIISLLKEIVEARKSISENYNYSFSTDVSKLEIVCDKDQIHQAMVNVLKNAEEALEYKEEGMERKIDVAIKQGDYLIIDISDNGKGFSEELISNATKPYVTSSSKGMGLGLAITKKIIEDHSGYMEINNLPTGGANLILYIDYRTLDLNFRK
jgi:two-component system nitrogen regulation sensor histidine kinase NtrY